jgi:hypothetical protein
MSAPAGQDIEGAPAKMRQCAEEGFERRGAGWGNPQTAAGAGEDAPAQGKATQGSPGQIKTAQGSSSTDASTTGSSSGDDGPAGIRYRRLYDRIVIRRRRPGGETREKDGAA